MEKHYGHLVRILHWCTHQVISQSLESLELTSAQGRIMGYLAHCPEPPCPRDIEQAFQLSHPTVSGLLSRLEQKGFVRLYTDPEDRRCKRIQVLPRGIQIQKEMHQTITANETQMVAGFTEEECAIFRSLLQRAIANMGGCTHPHESKEEPHS